MKKAALLNKQIFPLVILWVTSLVGQLAILVWQMRPQSNNCNDTLSIASTFLLLSGLGLIVWTAFKFGAHLKRKANIISGVAALFSLAITLMFGLAGSFLTGFACHF